MSSLWEVEVAGTKIEGLQVNIDLSTLRAIERERGVSVEDMTATIAKALLEAWEKSSGGDSEARVDVDPDDGHVAVIVTSETTKVTSSRKLTKPRRTSAVTSPALSARQWWLVCKRQKQTRRTRNMRR